MIALRAFQYVLIHQGGKNTKEKSQPAPLFGERVLEISRCSPRSRLGCEMASSTRVRKTCDKTNHEPYQYLKSTSGVKALKNVRPVQIDGIRFFLWCYLTESSKGSRWHSCVRAEGEGAAAAQLRTTAAATISLLNEWLQSCTQILEETTHTRHDINKWFDHLHLLNSGLLSCLLCRLRS